MLTNADTADSSDRPRDRGRSKELDRWKKPAYFDSARAGGGADERGTDRRRVKNEVARHWFGSTPLGLRDCLYIILTAEAGHCGYMYSID